MPSGAEGSATPKKDCGWHFIVLMSRQGKIRLSEFFSSYTESEKRRILRDIAGDVLPRQPKMCNIIEKGAYKFVYRRYASLYFVAGVPLAMNELIVLEQIHLFVEALDGYFNSGKKKKERDRKMMMTPGLAFVQEQAALLTYFFLSLSLLFYSRFDGCCCCC